ncbi:hypothetical protein ACROYT_G038550 [Oculina patagonica]
MCPTIKERTKFLFNKEQLSDVKFVVPIWNIGSDYKSKIPAHKFVFPISSPVFFAMFYKFLTWSNTKLACQHHLFSQVPRIGPFQRCRRIGKLVSVEEGGWYYHGSTNEIRFTVDKDVVFHGVQHFGSEEGKYEVSIKIKEPDDIFSRLTDPGFTEASGSYTSEKEENDEYYGFDVIFDHPVWLESAMKSVAPCRSSMISAHAPKEKKEEEKLEQEEEREE